MTSYKTPPEFVGKTYEVWRREVTLWQHVTDLKKDKQAAAVALSLKGALRDIAISMNLNELNTDDGMSILLAELDKHFKKEACDLAFDAYKKFEGFQRMPDQSMLDYIIEFEKRYNEMKTYDMELPVNVRGCKLLESAGLDQREKQIVLSSASALEYPKIQSSLKRIFGSLSFVNDGESASSTTVKTEVFVATKGPGKNWGKSKFSKSSVSKKKNPIGKDGKVTRCIVCGSIFHYAGSCPDSTRKKNSEVNLSEATDIADDPSPEESLITIALIAGSRLLKEAFNFAILDTACTGSICGQTWLDRYLHCLPEKKRKLVVLQDSNTSIMFGDMKKQSADFKVVLPIEIAGRLCNLAADVVSSDLPLLMSKAALKKAGAVIDTNNDSLLIFGKKVKLKTTSSGHYILPLLPPGDLVSTAFISEHENDILTSKELRKLHIQFGHCSLNSLSKLLKCANAKFVIEDVQRVIGECEVCKKTALPRRKPIVSLPLASEPNEVIAMDLHQLDTNLWYLHIICLFSRFSVAVAIRSKKAEVIIGGLVNSWISIFGPPSKSILTDNGGEFANEQLATFAEAFSFSLMTTAAYSPFSNGLCERHNRTLTEIFNKVSKEYPSFDVNTKLSLACCAKNNQFNNHGFTPSQIMLGRNPIGPSVISCKLPALNEREGVHNYVENLLALFNRTKSCFAEAEASERIRRALRHNVRGSTSCECGDIVYYRRQQSRNWKGPARVIGKDGKVIFLRHGSAVVRAHETDVLLENSVDVSPHNVHCPPPDSVTSSQNQVQVGHSEEEYSGDKVPKTTESTCDRIETPDVEKLNIRDSNDAETLSAEKNSMGEEESSDNIGYAPLIKPESHDDENQSSEVISHQNLGKPPKINSRICCRSNKNGFEEQDFVAKILSRAGKATGKYKNSYNIEYESPEWAQGQQACLDLEKDVESWEPIEDSEIFLTDLQSTVFQNAKDNEIMSWKTNDVYSVVPDTGQKKMRTRWILTMKKTHGRSELIPKARLVVKGYNEDLEKPERESPVIARESVKVFLSICSVKKWTPSTIDVKTAFYKVNLLTEKSMFYPLESIAPRKKYGSSRNQYTVCRMHPCNGIYALKKSF